MKTYRISVSVYGGIVYYGLFETIEKAKENVEKLAKEFVNKLGGIIWDEGLANELSVIGTSEGIIDFRINEA